MHYLSPRGSHLSLTVPELILPEGFTTTYTQNLTEAAESPTLQSLVGGGIGLRNLNTDGWRRIHCIQPYYSSAGLDRRSSDWYALAASNPTFITTLLQEVSLKDKVLGVSDTIEGTFVWEVCIQGTSGMMVTIHTYFLMQIKGKYTLLKEKSLWSNFILGIITIKKRVVVTNLPKQQDARFVVNFTCMWLSVVFFKFIVFMVA